MLTPIAATFPHKSFPFTVIFCLVSPKLKRSETIPHKLVSKIKMAKKAIEKIF